MTKLEKLRSRYMHDPIPVRLGGLAANLARVASFSKHPGHQEVVSNILHESRWLIEWTATQLEIQETAELATLQIQLAVWDLQSRYQWQDETWRFALSEKANRWSRRILEMSGLLKSS